MPRQSGRAGEAGMVRGAQRVQKQVITNTCTLHLFTIHNIRFFKYLRQYCCQGMADSVRVPACGAGRGGGAQEEGGVCRLRGPVLQQQGGGHPQGHLQVNCVKYYLSELPWNRSPGLVFSL